MSNTNEITSSPGADPVSSYNTIIQLSYSQTKAITRSNTSSKGQTKPPLHILAAFIALSLSIFLVALDAVLISTALPTIAQSFHIPDSLYAWVGSSYLLANASSVPFWGKLSDIFGRKPVILAANAIFLGGSILCAVSVNAPMLISGRVVQGLGGGGVVVLVHVCVSDLFTIRDRSFYMGTIGAVWALASALGPVLGGVFAQHLHWTWCFYINIPIVSLAIMVLYLTLHLPNTQIPLMAGLAAMDWLGTVTIITATILLLVGLQVGGVHSYSDPGVITCLVFGLIAYIAFPFSQWWVARHCGNPIMPLRIFKDVSNLSALAVCACDTLVFTSVAYFLPLYFQIVLGRSPSLAGAYMLAIAIPLAIVSFASGHIIEKTGHFLEVLQAGLFIMTLGVGLLISLGTAPSFGTIIAFLIVIGLGFGPNFGAPLIALQTRIPASDIAVGTAAFGFVRTISGAIGLVVGQVLFQLLMAPRYKQFMEGGIAEDIARRLTSDKAISESVTIIGLTESQEGVIRHGFMSALRGVWIMYTVIGAIGLLVSFGIKRTKLHRNMTTEFDSIKHPPSDEASGLNPHMSS
jgi:EmrB/QacA subfamily drug resistance transporter